MKKNGFTLIELLVTTTLIVLLAVLVTPKVNSIIKENRIKGYKEIENRLKEAANKYLLNHYVSEDSITITKEQLIEEKLIGEVYDLKDNSVCSANVVVTNITANPNFEVSLTCSNYVTS